MRTCLAGFIVFLVSLFTSSAVIHAEDIDLFVLAGQSNMQGWQGNAEYYPADPNGTDRKIRFYWVTPKFSNSGGKWTFMQPQGGIFPKGHFGPEVTFARLLATHGHDTAIFKYSLGSTGLARTWKAPGEGGMYDDMVNEIKRSVELLEDQGCRVCFKALVWIQGESDAERKELADEYGERLRVLIAHFRAEVAKDAQLPVLLGLDEQHAWVKEFSEVLEAQQRIANEDPNIMFTSMIGLEKAADGHLTPKGLEEHGTRLFDAYRKLTTKRKGQGRCGLIADVHGFGSHSGHVPPLEWNRSIPSRATL